jgi:hypothetical protein
MRGKLLVSVSLATLVAVLALMVAAAVIAGRI